MSIDTDLYEQWMDGLCTKVILEAKNEAQMKKVIDMAKEAGMIEDVDFFIIRDACLTEITPDETGTRWTCIGFAPMDAEKIDVVTGKLQLYKG
jgi:PTH2 family peptidyl-tRNA hydrolase